MSPDLRYRKMTNSDWQELAKAEKARADRLDLDNKALKQALRDLRDRISYALEFGRPQ